MEHLASVAEMVPISSLPAPPNITTMKISRRYLETTPPERRNEKKVKKINIKEIWYDLCKSMDFTMEVTFMPNPVQGDKDFTFSSMS
jgi:hypothetical protein